MSADNWDVCPRCYAKELVAYEKRQAAPANAYGKSKPEEYLRLVEQAKLPPKCEESLREDYEIGCTKTGAFYVIYSCACTVCGFRFEYKHDKQIKVEKD